MSHEISLTKGYVALVDNEDYERVSRFKWTATEVGRSVYAYRKIPGDNRKSQFLHRFITGVTDPKIEVDHKNHNGLDNQRLNLRVTDKTGNVHNARKWSSPTSSQYKGVSWNKRKQKWHVYIWINSKRKHLGYFDSEEIAAKVYDVAARELFGEFACLNS